MSSVLDNNRKPLSILFVSAQYLPHMGGVEKYTACLSQELLRQGQRVTIVCSCPGDLDDFTEGALRIVRMPSRPLMGGRYPLLRRNALFRRLESSLDSEQFDAVVVNTRFYPLSIWGVSFARRHGIVPLVIEHGSAPLTMGGAVTSWGVRLVERFMTRRLLRYKPAFAGVSRASAQWLARFGIHTEDVVYNCVDYEAIDACPAAVLSAPEGSIRLFFAGRLLEQKGLLPLLAAVDALQKDYPVVLYVAGEGPLREAVENAGKAVRYLGRLPFEEVISTIRATDIFCFPSVHPEGFPTSVMEAAACQACVVSTVRGGTAEILPDDSLAYRLEEATPDSIERALREAITHPDEAREKGVRLNAWVRRQFLWQRSAETLVRLCRRIQSE